MAITEDASQPAAVHITTTSGTTGSFSPPANSLLVALVAADGSASSAETASVSDSGSHAWTLLARGNTHSASAPSIGGTTEVWCCYLSSAPGSITVSASWTPTSGANGGNLVVRVLTGASSTQTGGTGTAGGGSVAPSVSVTTTQPGSHVYGAALNFATNASFTADSNTTFIDQFSDATNGDEWSVFKGSADTTTPGVTTFGATNANSRYNLAAAEILPAAADPPPVQAIAPGRNSPGGTWAPFPFPSTPSIAAVSAAAECATGTGGANQPTASVSPNTGTGAGTGAANQPSLSIAPNAGASAGTGAAGAPTPSIAPSAGSGPGAGSALNAAATISGATAGVATGTGTAGNPASLLAPNAGSGPGTAAAPNPAPSVSPSGGSGSGTGAGNSPVPAGMVPAGAAIGTGTANNASVNTSGQTNAQAECATGSGSAPSSAASIGGSAGSGSGTGAAGGPGSAVASSATVATGTASAPMPAPGVSPNGVLASGLAVASAATLAIQASTQAATALAAAFNGTVPAPSGPPARGLPTAESETVSVDLSPRTISVGLASRSEVTLR